jgi:hypothetical protein
VKYIYMNEHIKEAKPKDPVICTFDNQTKRVVYSDVVEIRDRHGVVLARVKYDPKGIKNSPHHAKAWVEVYDGSSLAKVTYFEQT